MPQAQGCWNRQWQEGLYSNICRIWISSCHKSAEKWKKKYIDRYFQKRSLSLVWHCSSCALYIPVADGSNPHCTPACQGLPLLPQYHALDSTSDPWAPASAQGLVLLEAGAAHPNPSIPGDSQNAQVAFCSGAHHPGAGARAKCGKPAPRCLQMLFSSRHWSPFLPLFSTLHPTPPDVTEGVTLLPQTYASCFSNPLNHTCKLIIPTLIQPPTCPSFW